MTRLEGKTTKYFICDCKFQLTIVTTLVASDIKKTVKVIIVYRINAKGKKCRYINNIQTQVAVIDQAKKKVIVIILLIIEKGKIE